MNLVFEIAFKSFILLAVAWALSVVTRRASASMRHHIWALAFVGLAILPLLTIRLPEIRIEGPTTKAQFIVPRHVSSPVSQLHTPPLNLPTAFESAQRTSQLDYPALFLCLWIVGATLLLGRLLFQLVVAINWFKKGEIVPTVEDCGIPPHTRVIRTSLVKVPMTLGALRPTIVLPTESTTWPNERLRAVLLHESAHIERGDWSWLIFSRIVGAVYWLNPLVYLALARLRVESELAADDAVLSAGVDAPSYASTLVELAASVSGRSMSATIQFVEADSLKVRITSILNGDGQRGPLSRKVAWFALVGCLAILVPYAAARIVDGPKTVTDGVVPFDDSLIEILAIGEVSNNKTLFWDLHGNKCRPFRIGKSDLDFFQSLPPVPKDSSVRYVIFRVEGKPESSPTFYNDIGESLVNKDYSCADEPGESLQDAKGGTYRIAKWVVPMTSSEGNLKVKVANGSWVLNAYQTYRKGELVEELNPTVNLKIAPVMPNLGKGTEATFDMSAEFADRLTIVRFLPAQSGSQFEGVTGHLSATTRLSPEKVTRVEMLSRPLKTIVIPRIPLRPRPDDSYTVRKFRPDLVIVSTQGTVELPDGSRVSIERLADTKKAVWDVNGREVAGNLIDNHGDVGVSTRRPDPSLRTVRIQMKWEPQDSNTSTVLFDGDGYPLGQSEVTIFDTTHKYSLFQLALDPILRTTDIYSQVPLGTFKTLARIERTRGWSFTTRPGSSGSLLVDFAREIELKTAGLDTDIRPLDAHGKPVTWPEGSLGYEHSSGQVQFNLPKSAADRVKFVEIRTRPLAWIKFPDVALSPL